MCMNNFGSRPVPVVELALLPLKIRVMQEPAAPTIPSAGSFMSSCMGPSLSLY